MVKLLSRLFLNKAKTDSEKRRGYGILCSVLGVFLNVFLFAVKFTVGRLSGSLSVTADAFNNLSDSGSSIITVLGFKLAAKKPDPGHPFGHGRMEYLSGLAVSVMITVMGVELAISSVKKIITPEAPEINAAVFISLAASILIKLYMFAYNRSYGKRFNSPAMLATASDSISDAASTAVVLISSAVTFFTSFNTDAYCGAAVSLFIIYAGLKSVYDTVDPLLGKPPEKEFTDKISEIVRGGNCVIGMHDLIVHDYGPGRRMITLHAEVPASGDVLEMHDEIDNLERRLSEELGCHAVIHMDPIQTDDEEVNRLRVMTDEVLEDISPEIKMHDFRVVSGTTHTNLIFDVLVSFSFKMSDSEIQKTVAEKLSQRDPSLRAVISVDRDYTESK